MFCLCYLVGVSSHASHIREREEEIQMGGTQRTTNLATESKRKELITMISVNFDNLIFFKYFF